MNNKPNKYNHMNKVEALVELTLNADAEVDKGGQISGHTITQVLTLAGQMSDDEIDQAREMYKRIT